MSTIHIKKGWYRSAGQKYGWVNMGYMCEGVGINRDAFDTGKTITVEVAGGLYEVDTQEALAFIRYWKSHYAMPGGTKVGVISRSIMKEIKDEDF